MPFPRSFTLVVLCLLPAAYWQSSHLRPAVGQESVPDDSAGNADAAEDFAALEKSLDELPMLPPGEQDASARDLVDRYFDRYADPVDYPEFEPVRNLRSLLEDLDRLPKLASSQQAMLAQELIEEYSEQFPGFVRIEELKRLITESQTFAALRESEQQTRDAASEWARHYWRSKCCPLPPWNPIEGSLRNETGHVVQYEQCLDGIYTSRWSGPYRLAAGAEQSSPHPFYVRYLSGGTVRMACIAPGTVYAFRGLPVDGTVMLEPAYGPAPVDVDPDVPAPAPAPAVDAEPATEDVPALDNSGVPESSDETPPLLEGPMIAP